MKNKLTSVLVLLLVYLISFTIGFIFYINVKLDIILKLFLTDVIATIVVYIFSLIFKNTSVYDPYWSVAPIYIVSLFIHNLMITNSYANLSIPSYFILGIVLFWSIRLTINWFVRFKDLTVEDWRYINLRKKKGWFFSNLFGCHLMPTIIVFLALMPVFQYLTDVNLNPMITLSTILGLLISLAGIIISLIADAQLEKYLKTRTNPKVVFDQGLFSRSRHPNYLGEIMFWVGLFLAELGINTNMFILGLGALLIVLLFVIISIPLLEKDQKVKKPGYAEYIENTNMLLLFPRKNKK